MRLYKINKKKLNLIIILSFFILSSYLFLQKFDIVFADEACSPYDCAGTNAYARVDNCVPASGYGCNNGSVTPSVNYTCPTGGGAGSCVGNTPGVEVCSGNVYQSATSETCICPDLSSCTTQGSACPYGGTCNCTPGGASGICESNAPGGPAVYANGCPYNNCPPRNGTRGCCLITSTPTYWCGNGTCDPQNNENCSNCQTDCGTCNPPPGPYCGDNNCDAGENNCNCATDCSGTCVQPPSCSVTLSPSTVNLYTDSAPFTITANVSNIQNGNVSQVEFSKSNNNISMNPVFDQNGAPYQSQITPISQGTTTLTANVYMGGSGIVCSTQATVNITVNNSPVDEAPDCDSFDVSDSSVTAGETVQYIAEISDIGLNLAYDGGFESGGMTFWPTAYQLNEWWAVPNATWPSAGSEGAYYAKISPLLSATDPHATTGWLETGQNLTNQNYTIKLKAKSHSSNETISNVYLQREPYLGDWTGHVAPGGNLSMALIPSAWQDFTTSGTWSNPGNGSTTSRFRVVLRPGSTHGGAWAQPVYYDSIKAYKTNTAGVTFSSVRFWYILNSADPCVAGNWTEIPGPPTLAGNFYTINWDTTGINPGDYTVAVNSTDIQGNAATGNPAGNCGNSALTARPACNVPQTITACVPSCGPDVGCGTLNQTPGSVSNITVNGISGNNLNLSNNPLPRTISWTAASISPPGAITAYDVWLLPRNAAIPGTCSGTCRVLTWTSGTSVSLPSVLATQTNNFDIVIRARNGCSTNGTWVRRAVDLTANVSGTIYNLATGPDGSNNCVGTGTPLGITAGAPTMVSSTGGNLTVSPGSTYTMSNVPYAPSSAWAPDYGFNLTLNLANPVPANSFYCNCPGGTPFSCIQTDTASPATNQNFFVTAVDLSHGPWWKSTQGNVYGAQGFTSNVADTASSYLIEQSAGLAKSAGIPMSGGSIGANSYYTEYNVGGVPPIVQPRANSTTHANLVREDYDYLTKNIDLGSVQTISTPLTALPNNGTIYDDAQVFYRNGDLVLNINAIQTVAAGVKKIIFVSGNVTINNTGAANRHIIDVADSGYLAIIAGGNITIANSVGNTCSYPTCGSTNTNIDGVYIASNQIIVDDDNNDATADRMFVGEGTFVGWGGIDLQRTFDNTTNPLDRALNNTYATEVFHFRPDFNENTPEILRRPNLVWQEVN